jgi:hypothetical protein
MKAGRRNDFWFRYNEIISSIIGAAIASHLLKGRPQENTSSSCYSDHIPELGDLETNEQRQLISNHTRDHITS